MELLEALKVIKDECGKHGRCEECPLRTEVIEPGIACEIRRVSPNCWNLSDAPRLFK